MDRGSDRGRDSSGLTNELQFENPELELELESKPELSSLLADRMVPSWMISTPSSTPAYSTSSPIRVRVITGLHTCLLDIKSVPTPT